MGYILYSHKDRCSNQVFYIGIGDCRARAYDEKSRSKEWKEKISECYFDVEIIAKNLTKELAFILEKSFIEMYQLENLINKTKGGVGSWGYKHTTETKKKLSNAQIGRKKTDEEIKKSVNSRIELHSSTYKHIKTGNIHKGLKNACEIYDINYKMEHQRISRNSFNKNFNIIQTNE